MGWGVRIPSLGIDSKRGKYLGISGGPKVNIGGDVGKALNVTSMPATIIGGGGLLNYIGNNAKTEKYNPTDFSGLNSRWDAITGGFTGAGLQNSLQQQEQMSQLGVNNAKAALAQSGGLGVGAAGRLARQSRWDMDMGEGQAVQDAELSKLQSQQQGVMGLDLPIAMGSEQAAAQAAASRSRNNASRWGTLGGLVGAGAGFAIGGPAGAGVGYNLGSGLGQNYGSRY